MGVCSNTTNSISDQTFETDKEKQLYEKLKQTEAKLKDAIAVAEQVNTLKKSLAMMGGQNFESGSVIPGPKTMSYLDHLSEKRKIEHQIEFSMGSGKIPMTPLFCTPNCQHTHHHNFQYDFSKNFKDPRAERPGVAFLEGLKS